MESQVHSAGLSLCLHPAEDEILDCQARRNKEECVFLLGAGLSAPRHLSHKFHTQ